MANFASKGRDLNGLPVSGVGATPYKGVWIQSKLENGRRIWWSYVALDRQEAEMLGTTNWAYFLYGSEDVRKCAYVTEKFVQNRAENIKSLIGMKRPKNSDSVTWGDRIEFPEFQYEALTAEVMAEVRKARAKAKAEKAADRPFRKARRGIGSY